MQSGKSLLPVGIAEVEGEFERGDLVSCLDTKGNVIARGLVNYNSKETTLLIRQPSNKIETLLGYVDEPEIIHRDNLILA